MRLYSKYIEAIIRNKGKGKGKGKFHSRTGHGDPEWEESNSPTLSLTSALDGVGGQHPPRPGRK
jgi:hypothetical protein